MPGGTDTSRDWIQRTVSLRNSHTTVSSVAVQWYRVFDEALTKRDAIRVSDAVAQYLGRIPTRSERHASCRAAHRYVAGSDAQILLLPASSGARARRVLVIARAGVDLNDYAALRRVTARSRQPDKPQGRLTKDVAQHVESLLTKVASAARAARIVPVDQIEPAHARLLAEDLTESVADLTVLAADLVRRSRQQTATRRQEES